MTSAALPVLADFPDRLSPMVVKELRQGLRTRGFAITLLMMHVLLIIATLITGSAENADETRWLFDLLAVVVLCLIMPFRVSNALAEEVKLNTLDMLLLTRLSCSRIVVGKWASVALQSLLIALSLMPYIVARYVFGGLDLSSEFLTLGSQWLGGCVLASALVALSTIRQAWLRMVIIIIPLFFFIFGMFSWVLVFLAPRIAGGPSFSGSFSIEVWAMVGSVVFSAWLIFAFLSLAASRISSAAEPLALVKRSVHLLAFFAPVVIYWFTSDLSVLAFCFPVLAVLTLDALTETLNDVPSAYVPFYRRGLLGRGLGAFLSPGWNSGFWLSFFLAGAIVGMMAGNGGQDSVPYFVLVACSVWMVSAIVQVLPTRRSHDLLPIFLGMVALISLIIAMFSGLGLVLAKSSGEQPWLLAALPPAAFIGAQALPSGPEREQFLRIAMACAAFWPLLHGILSLRASRSLRPVHEEARRLAATSPA